MAERSVQDRTRRRFERRRRARRWVVVRYVALVALVVGAVGFAGYALFLSSWLRVEGGQVSGTSQLSEEEVLEAADLPIDEPLVRADLDAVEARIRARLTAVKSVEAVCQWPYDILIEVEEWTPVAVVTAGASYSFLAESGDTFTFASMPGRPPAELPRVVVGSGADRLALEEAASVVSALDAAVATLVDHVEVQTADQILLLLDGGSQVTWGSAEGSEQKAAVLLRLLEAEPDARVYDVSVPSLPSTR